MSTLADAWRWLADPAHWSGDDGIRHRLLHMVRVWRRNAWRAAQYPAQVSPEDNLWEAVDDNPGPDPATGVAAREMCDRVRRVLPRDWYTVLRLYHAEGRTCQEIGRRFGLTRQRVQQVLNTMNQAEEFGRIYMSVPVDAAQRAMRFFKVRKSTDDKAAA